MQRNYERLGIKDFGLQLLDTQDLDPVYTALVKLEDQALIKRWLVAYWSLYHCGAASWLAEREGDAFWGHLYDAAKNETPAPPGGRWPRGAERRHWRAKNAVDAVEYMAGHWKTPEDLVDFLSNNDEGGRFSELRHRAASIPSNGPWIAFKIGDMLERVLDVPVNFQQSEVFMFDTPREAALLLWRTTLNMPESARPKDLNKTLTDVVCFVRQMFPKHMAPPHFDRPLGLQEIETILCKWKSHLGGHYPLGKDTHEIREGVQPWVQHSTTAALFQQGLPHAL